MARGGVTLNGVGLKEGDGAAVTEIPTLDIMAIDSSEVLLFDLA
jgi:quercetin 2,3-dioxygenase